MKYFLSLHVLCNLTNNFSAIRASFPGRHKGTASNLPAVKAAVSNIWPWLYSGSDLKTAASAYIVMSSCFPISVRDLPREHECKDKKRSLRTRMGRGNVGECKRLSTNPKMKRQLHSHPGSGFDVLRTVCQPNYRLLPTASQEMELVLHLK